MRVSNVKVYDLDESIVASGYPMRTDLTPKEMELKDLSRAIKLCQAADQDVPAHEQFLTGIRVNFDLTFSNKAWVEAERYRFLEFVSSQSTMHRMIKFNLATSYNEYVDPRAIAFMQKKVKKYNDLCDEIAATDDPQLKETLTAQKERMYLEILYTNPAGFELTARMTTNYRCLKNIYNQRRNHRLPEWREFCKWIETLPCAQELIMTRQRVDN